MADVADIEQVRRGVDEPDDSNGYTDEVLGGYVDDLGVRGATRQVWIEKAAAVAKLVDVSDGSSSRKLSQLHEQFLAFADYYADGTGDVDGGGGTGRTRIHRIVRDAI